jgi:hypothetical protein
MTEDYPASTLDELFDSFGPGIRNVRREAERLRGTYLTRWMDFEEFVDALIGEYLEVPEHREADMIRGLLPLLPSGRKIEFIQTVVKRVDPTSDAYTLANQALVNRNALAHRPASYIKGIDTDGDDIPVLHFKGGEERVTYINGGDALTLLDRAGESVFNLTMLARPDYLDRLKARTEQWDRDHDGRPHGEE